MKRFPPLTPAKVATEVERWLRERGEWEHDDCFQTPAEHKAAGFEPMQGCVLVLFLSGELGGPNHNPRLFDDFEAMIWPLGMYAEKSENWWYFFRGDY